MVQCAWARVAIRERRAWPPLSERMGRGGEDVEKEAGQLEVAASAQFMFPGERLNERIAALSYRLGLFIATKPWVTVMLSVAVCCLLTVGAALLEMETRIQYLYSPRELKGFVNYEKMVEHFGEPYREAALVLTADDGGSVLQKQCLVEAVALHRSVIADVGSSETYADICAKPFVGGQCITGNALDVVFQSNATMLGAMSQNAILAAVGAVAPHLPSLLSGLAHAEDGSLLGAQAMLMHYSVSSDPALEGVAVAWEGHFLEAAEKAAGAATCLSVRRFATRSVDDEVNRIVAGEGYLMGIAVGMILVYMSVTLGTCGKVTGRVGLGMSSVLVVNLALGSAFGLSGYFGVPLTSISGMAVFVVAGIGVDDIFIVVHAMDRQSRALPLSERLALALYEAGPAIFLTSVTNLLAFIVSSFVDFPAVEYFVVICGFAIFSTFGLTITLFAAFLFLDEQRQARGGRDVFCCMDDDPANAVTSDKAVTEDADKQTSSATDSIIQVILNPAVSGACIVVMIALAVAGFSTADDLTIGLDLADTMPDGSYVTDYMNEVMNQWGDVQPPVDLIVVEATLQDAAVRSKISGLVQLLRADPFVTEWPCWLDDFERWHIAAGGDAILTATAFGTRMKQYLASAGVAGWPAPGQLVEPSMHSANVEWSTAGTEVVSLRFTGRVGMPNDRQRRFTSLADLRAVVTNNPVESGAVDTFIYSYSYIFVDRDEATVGIMFTNLGLAGLTVTICLMLLLHPGIALTIALCICLIDGLLVGLLCTPVRLDHHIRCLC